jgi:GTPase SAR1 family protein
MASNGTTSRLDSLQASEQLYLLDEIDKLRLQGISEFVFLPQLIVCGDQSSGKSSVLEAISGVPFPRKDNLCTRFATELILRKSRTSSTSVSIVPSRDRPEPEYQKLCGFSEKLESLDDLPTLIDRAKIAMGVSDTGSAFSKDVLRVEVSGPAKPHLTIVDLPGLIHSENKQQSANDVKLVSQLVLSYMENPRTIILAVVSAMNDIANQIVLKRAKEVDHEGLRTLGLITKPDTLPQGSESEMAFVNLAKNENVEFRLGWHVLRNRDYHTRHSTMEARDKAETEFFSKGAWLELRRDFVGISALRSRLSSVLFHQIKTELPSLIKDVQQEIEKAQTKLFTLGESRSTPDEQRLFLLNLSQAFFQLCKASCDGVYDDQFFGDSLTDMGYIRRLRAVVQHANLKFAETMRKRGHRRDIKDTDDTEGEKEKRLRGELPEKISRKEALDRVRLRLTRSRGRELPGTFNPLLIGELFHEQASPWRALATEHLEQVWKATKVFLENAIKSLTDPCTYDALFRYWIDVILEEKLQRARKTLDRLMEDCDKHPITYNHYFIENLQNTVQKRREEEVSKRLKEFFSQKYTDGRDQVYQATFSFKSLVASLSLQTEADTDTYACIEILDRMEAYYKVLHILKPLVISGVLWNNLLTTHQIKN